jgi:hypothetical protein
MIRTTVLAALSVSVLAVALPARRPVGACVRPDVRA